jgi:hypothetical protein
MFGTNVWYECLVRMYGTNVRGPRWTNEQKVSFQTLVSTDAFFDESRRAERVANVMNSATSPGYEIGIGKSLAS